MSIDKYKKTVPDLIIENSSAYSTDGQNIRCYKVSNVSMENNNCEWAYSTNFNHDNYIGNTYVNNFTTSEDSYKTGVNISRRYTEPLRSDTFIELDKESITWENVQGLSFGLLFNVGLGNDYSNLYIPENLNYDKIILHARAYNHPTTSYVSVDNNSDTYISNGFNIRIYFNTGTEIIELPSNFGAVLYKCTRYNGKINARSISISEMPEIQLYSRWYQSSRSNTINAELPHLSNSNYNLTTGYLTNNNEISTMFTLPDVDPLEWEKSVWTTQYGTTYGGFIYSSSTANNFIKLLNATGLRYYDGVAHTEYNDILENTFIGVMDNDGITDCNSRIKGWDIIDDSDLPNAHRNGYDWEIVDPTHPPVEPDKDDTEKMNIGGYYTAGGLVNYYSLVNTPEYRPLDRLSENLSSWDYVATGKDVLRNLVSLKAFPISRELLCRGTPKEIVIAGTQTGVNGQTVDSTYSIINLGSVSIPHRYNDFRDYAPYTKIELCCPFVGWLQLPTHCMGHNVNVQMTYDIITGSCTVYVILDENTIVAQACGCIAYDIPFTADAVGMKTMGMITGITGVASSALSLGTGLVSGNIVGSASGIIGLANSVTQTICANNANYTETKGTTGDSNNFAGVKQCYLKITYPVSHIPENYGESVGYIYNNTATLTQGMGFTKTSNTKITGTMLDTEQNEIKSLMESGVIL